MTDPRDYKLDLHSGPAPAPLTPSVLGSYLSVRFACCGAYQRIYRARDGSCYRGRCPRCGKPVRFPIGPGGTSHRFFVVT
jgi:hypothetical protein